MASNISNTRRWFQFLFPLTCYFVFAYPIHRLSNWFDPQLGVGYVAAIIVWLISVAAMWYSFSGPKIVVRYVVVHWMGASFIFAILTLLAEGLRLILPATDRQIAFVVAILGILCVIAAVLISHYLAVKKVSIKSKKVTRPYRIVQISDVHIGSRQQGFMQRIVNRINTLQPDFIVVTGDLIDSSAVDYEALQSINQLKSKTYFSIGNHERYADLPKILNIAERLGMHILRQQTDRQEELTFIGVDDADDRDQVGKQLPAVSIDTETFNILLYHRPVGWWAARQHGVDLMLSGHTHNGQIFPFNWIVKQQFDRIRGLHSKENAHLYVSSGTGTWGPLMRLGSLNEITLVEISPAEP